MSNPTLKLKRVCRGYYADAALGIEVHLSMDDAGTWISEGPNGEIASAPTKKQVVAETQMAIDLWDAHVEKTD